MGTLGWGSLPGDILFGPCRCARRRSLIRRRSRRTADAGYAMPSFAGVPVSPSTHRAMPPRSGELARPAGRKSCVLECVSRPASCCSQASCRQVEATWAAEPATVVATAIEKLGGRDKLAAISTITMFARHRHWDPQETPGGRRRHPARRHRALHADPGHRRQSRPLRVGALPRRRRWCAPSSTPRCSPAGSATCSARTTSCSPSRRRRRCRRSTP